MESNGNSVDYTADIIILTFLFGIFLISFFILRRFPGFHLVSPDMTPVVDVPVQSMRQVHNPFIIKLHDASSANMTDGVSISFTSLVASWSQALWGVSINDIYPVIYSAWVNFEEDFTTSQLLPDSHKYKQEFLEPEPVKEKIIKLVPYDESGGECSLDLGAPPRTEYPLVLITVDATCLGEEPEDLIQLQQITCVITIFHIRDAHCPAESQIISQFIRTPSGRPVNLQRLFVSEDDSNLNSNYPDTASSEKDSLATCIVCQTTSVTRAILPCRHVALCDDCFVRMTSCPMCRGPITSYFRLYSTHNDPETVES